MEPLIDHVSDKERTVQVMMFDHSAMNQNWSVCEDAGKMLGAARTYHCQHHRHRHYHRVTTMIILHHDRPVHNTQGGLGAREPPGARGAAGSEEHARLPAGHVTTQTCSRNLIFSADAAEKTRWEHISHHDDDDGDAGVH